MTLFTFRKYSNTNDSDTINEDQVVIWLEVTQQCCRSDFENRLTPILKNLIISSRKKKRTYP